MTQEKQNHFQVLGNTPRKSRFDENLARQVNEEVEREERLEELKRKRDARKGKKEAETPTITVEPPANAPNLSSYIFVPTIGLYVAKQRTPTSLNWYQTHEKLQKQELRMPTIPQFLEYLKFLQNGYQDRNEAQRILDDILKVGNWRAEWLDARFESSGKDLLYCYEHKVANSQIVDRKSEKLENCLMKDCYADIFNSTNTQGLPRKKLGKSYEQGKNAYFYYPRVNFVAGFDADSGRACLDCGSYPTGTLPSLGVRGVCEANAQKI